MSEKGKFVLSVPDNKVIVKSFNLDRTERWDARRQAQFEMSVSMLDSQDEFCFDIIYTGYNKRNLGLATRRQHLEQLTNAVFNQQSHTLTSLRYQMRAVALGKGYLTFCHPEGKGLECLVDFGDEVASLCFVLERHIVGLAHLSTSCFDFTTEHELKKMAVELKTIVNYKQASFLEDRCPGPLSALLVSGDNGNGEIRSVLQQRFPVAVSAPQVDDHLLTCSPQDSEVPLDSYIVALGLTVD